VTAAPPRAAPGLPLLFFAAAAAPMGMNILLPALVAIGAAFSAPAPAVQLTVTIYLVGYAIVQLVVGPLADRFGRRPVLVVSFVLFLAGSIAATLAPTLEALVWARALQSIGGCAALVVPRAVVRDLYTGPAAIHGMTRVTMAVTATPALAPLVGSAMLMAFGWRGVFGFCAAYSAVLLVLILRGFGETLAPAQRTGDAIGQLAVRYGKLLATPRYLGYAANFACQGAGFLLFVAFAPILVIRDLGVGAQGYGLLHLLLGLLVIAGNFLAPSLARRFTLERVLLAGSLVCVAAFGTLLALSGELSLARLVLPMLVYAIANGVIFPLAITGATGVDPRAIGTAAALLGSVQMGYGATVVFIAGRIDLDGAMPLAGVGLASAVLGTVALLLVRRP